MTTDWQQVAKDGRVFVATETPFLKVPLGMAYIFTKPVYVNDEPELLDIVIGPGRVTWSGASIMWAEYPLEGIT